MSPPFILVTGAAGFIAHHLIGRLLQQGQPVLGVDCFDPFYDRSIKERNIEDLKSLAERAGTEFRFLEADLNDLTLRAFEKSPIECVVHLGAKAGVRPSIEAPESYVKANVTGTMRLLEVLRELGIRDMLFGSSSSVYGDDSPVPFKETAVCDRPISPYAATKRAGELLCANYAHLYGFRIAALRFFTVYGPRQRPDLAIHKFARLIWEGKPVTLYGDGTTSRDYTFASDIVDGIEGARRWMRAAPRGTYEVFNLGGSATTPLHRLVSLIEERIGKKAIVRWEPRQPGDVERTFADVSKSHELLGYSPRVPIETGLTRFTEWFLTTRK